MVSLRHNQNRDMNSGVIKEVTFVLKINKKVRNTRSSNSLKNTTLSGCDLYSPVFQNNPHREVDAACMLVDLVRIHCLYLNFNFSVGKTLTVVMLNPLTPVQVLGKKHKSSVDRVCIDFCKR